MQTSASRVSSVPCGLVDLRAASSTSRRRRDRPRVAEGLPVRVLAGLGVRRAVVEEEGHADQRVDPAGRLGAGERDVAQDLLARRLASARAIPCWPIACEQLDAARLASRGRGSPRSAGPRRRRRRGRSPCAPRARPGRGRARSRARPCRRPPSSVARSASLSTTAASPHSRGRDSTRTQRARPRSGEHEVVAVHGLLGGVREQLADLVGAHPLDPAQLARRSS